MSAKNILDHLEVRKRMALTGLPPLKRAIPRVSALLAVLAASKRSASEAC
jgi:hypothetical protein